jgi:hypothetical protein
MHDLSLAWPIGTPVPGTYILQYCSGTRMNEGFVHLRRMKIPWAGCNDPVGRGKPKKNQIEAKYLQ